MTLEFVASTPTTVVPAGITAADESVIDEPATTPVTVVRARITDPAAAAAVVVVDTRFEADPLRMIAPAPGDCEAAMLLAEAAASCLLIECGMPTDYSPLMPPRWRRSRRCRSGRPSTLPPCLLTMSGNFRRTLARTLAKRLLSLG